MDPIGRSCGLALFYNNMHQVKVLYSSNRMIYVEAEALGKKIFLTFVYGDPVKKIKRTSLGTINTLWVIALGSLVYNWRFK